MSFPLRLIPLALIFALAAPAVRADEIRAIWVTRWDYRTPADVAAILSNIASHNFNTVLFQVRGNATTFYPSSLEPWAWELTGSDPSTLGTDPGWNPLATAVSVGHALGLEIHAYMNTYPAWIGTTPPPPTSPRQLWLAHPEWFCVDSDGNPMTLNSTYVALSPGVLAARRHLTDVYAEVVNNFDVDGVHLDYVRYLGSQYSHDAESLARFAAEYGGATPSSDPTGWQQFRRDQVTALVRSVEIETHAAKPGCQVTAAVFSNYAAAATDVGQDSWGWLASGLLDVSHPMIYTASVSTHRTRTEEHITHAADRFVSAGISAHQLAGYPARLLAEVQNTRDLGTHGVTIFSYAGLFPDDTPNSLADALIAGPFAYPDNPPTRLWLTTSGDDDNTGPRIFNVRTDPDPPVNEQPFTVLADVTDLSGLFDDATGPEGQGMWLRWAFDADPATGTVVQMSLQSGDTYVTDAPIAVPTTGTLNLQITAHDNDADTGPGDRAARESAILSFAVTLPVPQRPPPPPIYLFDAVIGPAMSGPQYAVMDPQGRLWVCSYSGDAVRVFDQSGAPAPLDPITSGLDAVGAPTAVDAPSGVACGPDGTIFVSIDDAYDEPLHEGILRFDSTTGAPIVGIDLPFRPGDCDVDAAGNLYVVEKINDRWHRFAAPDFAADAVFGAGMENHVNRGIACRDDGARVYVACEADDSVHTWLRTSVSPLIYTPEPDLCTVTGASGAVDVDAHGWVFAADQGENRVRLFTDGDDLVQEIQGGIPPFNSPRGVAHTPDSDFIYIVPFGGNGQVQRWRRNGSFLGTLVGLSVLGRE
jgi:uncharacterized lipoprotein YddW (UPF0748 family)/DNA-binding beta-propeller fold protein YncE